MEFLWAGGSWVSSIDSKDRAQWIDTAHPQFLPSAFRQPTKNFEHKTCVFLPRATMSGFFSNRKLVEMYMLLWDFYTKGHLSTAKWTWREEAGISFQPQSLPPRVRRTLISCWWNSRHSDGQDFWTSFPSFLTYFLSWVGENGYLFLLNVESLSWTRYQRSVTISSAWDAHLLTQESVFEGMLDGNL